MTKVALLFARYGRTVRGRRQLCHHGDCSIYKWRCHVCTCGLLDDIRYNGDAPRRLMHGGRRAYENQRGLHDRELDKIGGTKIELHPMMTDAQARRFAGVLRAHTRMMFKAINAGVPLPAEPRRTRKGRQG